MAYIKSIYLRSLSRGGRTVGAGWPNHKLKKTKTIQTMRKEDKGTVIASQLTETLKEYPNFYFWSNSVGEALTLVSKTSKLRRVRASLHAKYKVVEKNNYLLLRNLITNLFISFLAYEEGTAVIPIVRLFARPLRILLPLSSPHWSLLV